MKPRSASRLVILHTNDIHGRAEGLARAATLVEHIRSESGGAPVLYFDLGDSEDTSNRLSNLTKGVSMHRLLSAAGCDAVAVGNAALPRYGPQVLKEQAGASRYPHLLANLLMPDGSHVPGTQPAALLDLGALRLGLIGVTNPQEGYATFFKLRALPAPPLIRDLSAGLRKQGAGAIALLSHMGLEGDRELAAELQDEVALILGAHSHSLLPEGERVGRVLIAQAGEYAEHVGRIDLAWDGEQLSVTRIAVLPVGDTTPPSARVLSEVAAIEHEVEQFLDEVIGELAEPLDYASDRECGVAHLMAEALRQRMDAEIGAAVAGQAFTGPLPAGPLRRITLWDICPSTANPGVATLTGAQLAEMIRRGRDLQRAAERPHMLRGQARGLMHLSGATVSGEQALIDGQPLDPVRAYRVASTDYELEPTFGYVDADWHLNPQYELPIILREVLAEYLAARRPPHVQTGPASSVNRGIRRWAIKQTVFVLILAAVLFTSAGRFTGVRAWLYLSLVALIQGLTALVLIPRSPDLLIERSQLREGVKTWDIGLAVLMAYSPVLMALAAGLETRFIAPPADLDAASIIAVLVAVLGTLLTLWAMTANPFFSGIVRIQHERGHTVASAGPYQYVRHPGYVGMLAFILATPLILGSLWAFGPAILATGITVVRTSLEDRTLQRELEGYAEYGQRVRYRLVPGIW
jgi:2',3'-cyclic-nucleotide 2'-phosphodiesterase (5'-nucleotidase family)/protein-S-isoprenylcysteine O-methyltransferase Ste14